MALLALVSSIASAGPAELERARKAYGELRYDAARRELDALLARGGLARTDLVAAWALSAELACILDGADAGERAFRRVLVLEPDYRGPERDSPVFLSPLARAREWARTAGRLRIRHQVPVARRDARPLEIAVEVAADPLGMVADLRVHWRFGARGEYQLLGGDGLRRRVDEPAPGTSLQYHLEVVDTAGDVLWESGSASSPLVVRTLDRLVSAPPPSARSRRPPVAVIVAAAAAGAFLAGGIAFDVAAKSEYDDLEMRCAPGCTGDDLDGFHRRERAAVGLYVAAGAAAVTATSLWWFR
jgi:hypothetical protein